MAATKATRASRALASAKRSLSTAAAVHPPPLYLTGAGSSVISPWHDIPLRPTGASDPALFHFVNEIPRGGRAKMEIATDAPGNPIIQDSTKKGDPRFYFLDSLVNYGAIPQTYEDPDHKDAWTGLLGDGDPVDVCDIGSAIASTGQVYTVKVLGALAMLDGGETDWKILAIRADDPAAAKVQDIASGAPDAVLRQADAIREWFRTYKIPEGKGENSFAFDGKWLDRDTALKVIDSTHKQWVDTLAKRTGKQEKKQPWLPSLQWNASQVAQPGYKPSSVLNLGTSTAKPANLA